MESVPGDNKMSDDDAHNDASCEDETADVNAAPEDFKQEPKTTPFNNE